MIRVFMIALGLLGGGLGSAAASDDVLRFVNGDQLHGRYEGMKDDGAETLWKREDLDAAASFKVGQIRHIILNGGRALKALPSLANIGLINGDRIPGEVVGLDGETVTVDTVFAGQLKIPRPQVSMLAPSPLGGRVFYYGPFQNDEWQMVNPLFKEGVPEVKANAEAPEGAPSGPGRWSFTGTAWIWQNKDAGTALLRKEIMPERAILRFDLSWKNRLSLVVGFHADFAPLKAEEDEEVAEGRNGRFIPGDSTLFPAIFGNGYVLHMMASHLMLYRTSVEGDRVVAIGRVQVNPGNARLGDTGRATVEIRSNHRTGQVTLFVNDEFAAQWSEPEGLMARDPERRLPEKAGGIGFAVQNENSPVRISDVTVAEWNGMPDSARSLQVDEQDIVLLANGTDRFSGKVKSIQDGTLLLNARFGDFQLPMEEVAEIRFARKGLAEPVEEASGSVRVRLGPIGRVSGRPLGGDGSLLRMIHPVAGEMQIRLECAMMLDFQTSNTIIDDWNSEF